MYKLHKQVKKVVIPAAGIGRRLWPATKSIPKEMLTVVDRPLIDYAVEEAKAAGIEQFVFITRIGNGKQAIQDYFDDEHFIFLNQPEPHGLGHAIYCAKDVIGEEPFAVMLPDDLFQCQKPCLGQLLDVYNENNLASCISVSKVNSPLELKNYGVVDPGQDGIADVVFRIRDIVEKPDPDDAPSPMAVVGRYVLQPDIFDYLEDQTAGKSGEIELTDAIRRMILDGYNFQGIRFKGKRYDCGDRLGFIEANVGLGLADDKMRQKLNSILKRLCDAGN